MPSQLGWLVLAASATAAPLLLHLPLWLAALAALLYGWRLLLWWQRAPLPPRWLLMLCVAVAVGSVMVAYHTLFGREAGVGLLILFLALKLMEVRQARDAVAVLLLCYFLQIALFFENQSPAIALYVVADLVLITAAMAALCRDGRAPRVQLRQAAVMVLQAAPFMLVLFVLFPRVQGPLWGMPRDAYSGLSGLSDSMAPGNISQLSLSGAIAFRVQFDGPPPPQRQLYWRGPVLSRFDGRAWHAARVGAGNAPPYPAAGQAVSYSVTLEAHDKPWLFGLELAVRLPTDALISTEYQPLAKQPVITRIRYAMASIPGLIAGADESPEVLTAATRLPQGWNPRARQLAQGWRDASADTTALIATALRHFNQQPFVYTLSPPLLGGHSVDEFLFDTRRGFCEHFASGFVFLMRAAGVPARVVTGYQGGETNPVDGYLIVRQSDAHAWAEVWIANRGWQRVDPTAAVAPSRIERGVAAALPDGDPLPFAARSDFDWLRAVRFRWEAMSNAWDQWVLGYNPDRQRELLSRLGLSNPDWQALTAAMTAITGALMLALAAWTLRRRHPADPVQRSWDRLSRKLAPIGLARRVEEGPLDYARRVAASRAQLAEPMQKIALLYADLRYGPYRGEEQIAELRRLVNKLGTQ